MTKGANTDLSGLTAATGPFTVALSWLDPSGKGEADVSVFLVDADGKVSSDADFVFYNQPATADESVRLLGKIPTATGSEDRILIDLGALRPEVQRVVIAASRYASRTFGALDDLRLTVSESAGEVMLAFDIVDADIETAFILGELYRRGDGWKFRAVGQGYVSGLAVLAADFGINVDDSDEKEDNHAPSQQAATPEPDGPDPQARASARPKKPASSAASTPPWTASTKKYFRSLDSIPHPPPRPTARARPNSSDPDQVTMLAQCCPSRIERHREDQLTSAAAATEEAGHGTWG